VPVAHLDLYRLEGVEDEDPGLLEDYLDGDTIGFVEWPQAADPGVGRVRARVEIRHAGGDRREIEVRR
jgi:tRNA A37 threonylcarbamoyladenosine biosynthesis protein TsaE